jgi:putative nucleotidyltransferase with HDIG domain
MLSRSFNRVTRFTRQDAGRLAIATFLLVGGLTAILSIGDLPQAYNLQEGSVAPQQIRSPRAIRFESAVKTATARQAASDGVEPQYDFSADTASTLARRQLEALATTIAPVDAAFIGPLTAVGRSAALAGTLPGISSTARKTLDAMEVDRWSMVAAEATRVLGTLQRSELRDSEMEGTRRNLGGLFSPQLTDDERGLATEIVDPLLVPNSTYSAELTAQKRQAAADAVTPVEVAVAKGEVVVDAGRRVDAADIEKLAALGLTEARLDIARIAGWFLLAGLIVILYLAWLWRYRQELWHRARTLALLGLVLLVTALAYKLTAGRSVVPFFVPGAGAGMLVSILLGAGPATVLSFFLAVIAGASNDLSLELATYVFVGSMTGILAVRRGDRVAVFLQAGIAIAIANIAVVSIFSLLGTRDITGVLQLFGASAAAAAGAAVATVGTFQAVGNVFGILTVFQLLELANPSQALLRRLLLETPGTYHHALMVGNLAERAAEAIGADSLLARVASYYHDVGKLENPAGFIENQAGGENVHDHLSPEASAQLLKAHVSGGIDLAYRSKLPKPLIAFIPQHHGTARMSYFWAKAREEAAAPHGGLGTSAGLAAADALDERRFRHNGPKPQSKEAAILMLADGVEASVRSLASHDEPTIRGMVSRIITERLEDGQFDECELTLRDIERVREAFVAQLLGMYHQRIAYPQNKIVELEARREASAGGRGT